MARSLAKSKRGRLLASLPSYFDCRPDHHCTQVNGSFPVNRVGAIYIQAVNFKGGNESSKEARPADTDQ